MAIDFIKMMNRTPEEKKLSEYKLHLRLATMCVDAARSNSRKANSELYYALEHLSEVPECSVDINDYCDLPYATEEFDTNACLVVKEKLKLLEEVIADMTAKGDSTNDNTK